jgi:hypothetical protein
MKWRLHMWPVTRRATLRISISAAICGLFPSWKASAQTRISDELQARFLRWSRTATGFADLSPDAARACMELVLRSGISAEALSNLAPDAYGGTPIEKQLLEAWYTGIFKLDGLPDVRLSNDIDVASRRDRPTAEHLRRRPRTLGFRALQYLTRDVWPSKAMS